MAISATLSALPTQGTPPDQVIDAVANAFSSILSTPNTTVSDVAQVVITVAQNLGNNTTQLQALGAGLVSAIRTAQKSTSPTQAAGSTAAIIDQLRSSVETYLAATQVAVGGLMNTLETLRLLGFIRSPFRQAAPNIEEFLSELINQLCNQLGVDFTTEVFTNTYAEALQLGISSAAYLLQKAFEAEYCDLCSTLLPQLLDNYTLDKRDLGTALGRAAANSVSIQADLCDCLIRELASCYDATAQEVLEGVITANPDLVDCLQDAATYYPNILEIISQIKESLVSNSCLCRVITALAARGNFAVAAQLYCNANTNDKICLCNGIPVDQVVGILLEVFGRCPGYQILPGCVCTVDLRGRWVQILAGIVTHPSATETLIQQFVAEAATNIAEDTDCCSLMADLLLELVARSAPVETLCVVLNAALESCPETVICDWFTGLMQAPLIGSAGSATLLAKLLTSGTHYCDVGNRVINTLCCLCPGQDNAIDFTDLITDALIQVKNTFNGNLPTLNCN